MKKAILYVIVGVLAVALVGVGAFAAVLTEERDGYARQLASNEQAAFASLKEEVDTLAVKFTKLLATADPVQTGMLLADIWRQTGNAAKAIGGLTLTAEQSGALVGFMNTAGDYAHQLSYTLANGDKLKDEDVEQLKALQKACATLKDELYTLWDTDETPAVLLENGEREAKLTFEERELPRLIYDGPFSESVQNKKPQGLTGETVDRSQARKRAAAFLAIEADALTGDGETAGVIETYDFNGEKDGRALTVSVTKQGGHILHYFMETTPGMTAVPTDERADELTSVAVRYAEGKGFAHCESSYVQYYEGNAVVNLVPLANGVRLYPDLIKVWVSIEDDAVVGLDCDNYLMSHTDRALGAAALSEAEARKKIADSLTVERACLALIPLDTGKEALCWEFACKLDETDCIVYMDASTGKQQDVLVIRHTNEGTLTQ